MLGNTAALRLFAQDGITEAVFTESQKVVKGLVDEYQVAHEDGEQYLEDEN
jgi:hypothetical protein